MKTPTSKKTAKASAKPWLFPHVEEWERVQSKKRDAAPCEPAKLLRVALDALAALEAAAPQPDTIAAVLDIGEAACRAIKRLELVSRNS